MNERIKDLAIQAGLVWNTAVPHYTNTSNQIDFPRNPNKEIEDFAYLIIAHCTKSVRDVLHDDASTLCGDDASAIQNRIKSYFGVE